MYIYIERILTTGCLRCPQCHIYLRIYIYMYMKISLSHSLSRSRSLPLPVWLFCLSRALYKSICMYIMLGESLSFFSWMCCPVTKGVRLLSHLSISTKVLPSTSFVFAIHLALLPRLPPVIDQTC